MKYYLTLLIGIFIWGCSINEDKGEYAKINEYKYILFDLITFKESIIPYKSSYWRGCISYDKSKIIYENGFQPIEVACYTVDSATVNIIDNLYQLNLLKYSYYNNKVYIAGKINSSDTSKGLYMYDIINKTYQLIENYNNYISIKQSDISNNIGVSVDGYKILLYDMVNNIKRVIKEDNIKSVTYSKILGFSNNDNEIILLKQTDIGISICKINIENGQENTLSTLPDESDKYQLSNNKFLYSINGDIIIYNIIDNTSYILGKYERAFFTDDNTIILNDNNKNIYKYNTDKNTKELIYSVPLKQDIYICAIIGKDNKIILCKSNQSDIRIEE